VFWVTGKPGAGKSTLMKYLAHHSSLKQHLQIWAGTEKLVIAEYYFWKAGSLLQRSTCGLLRSLLYQILRQRRDLIGEAFVDHEWRIAGDQFQFSQETLQNALAALLDKAQTSGFRFIFFVDGLDELNDREEYSSDIHDGQELIEFLRIFHNRIGVKMCVSNRPWNTFYKEFGQNDSHWFRINDITRDDIKAFAEERLYTNSDFKKLTSEDDSSAALVREITDAAQGVFLWVRLATDSLLRLLTDGFSILQLREEFKRFPEELYGLYEHMLKSIPERYQQISSRILLATSTYSNKFPLSVCLYLEDSERLAIMQKDTISNDLPLKAALHLSRRLNAYCRGLVEAYIDREEPWETLLKSNIVFPHRTVLDFLKKYETRRYLKSTVGNNCYLPSALARSGLAMIKESILLLRNITNAEEQYKGCWPPACFYLKSGDEDISAEHIVRRIGYTFFHPVEVMDIDEALPLWDECDALCRTPILDSRETLLSWWIKDRLTYDPPLALNLRKPHIIHIAIKFSCRNYLARQLADEPFILEPEYDLIPPLLFQILSSEIMSTGFSSGPSPAIQGMLTFLLECGADPNQAYARTTIWIELLKRLNCYNEKHVGLNCCNEGHADTVLDTIKSFIDHGADLTATIEHVAFIANTSRRNIATSAIRQVQIFGRTVYCGSIPAAWFKSPILRNYAWRDKVHYVSHTSLVVPITSMLHDICRFRSPKCKAVRSMFPHKDITPFEELEWKCCEGLLQKLHKEEYFGSEIAMGGKFKSWMSDLDYPPLRGLTLYVDRDGISEPVRFEPLRSRCDGWFS
jgi:hypothetical protein